MDDIERGELVERYWPHGGPHSPDSVTSAASTIDDLAHYLSNATGGATQQASLPSVPSVRRLLVQLAHATGEVSQLIRQLSARLDALANDPSLAHEDPDASPVTTVVEASVRLGGARVPAEQLRESLDGVRDVLFPIGHRAAGGASSD